MAYSLDPIADQCYPGTTVLVNKFGIRDEAKLNELESTLTAIRNAEWLSTPLAGNFDFDHYRAIHRYLFSDLYDWAGEIRTVNISKKGTRFCDASSIETEAEKIFRRLRECNYFKSLPRVAFIEEILDFYCITNALHPFREGNGRTQRVFLTQLIRNAGYDIQFNKVDTDLLMLATIQSSQGIIDLLRQVFEESII